MEAWTLAVHIGGDGSVEYMNSAMLYIGDEPVPYIFYVFTFFFVSQGFLLHVVSFAIC